MCILNNVLAEALKRALTATNIQLSTSIVHTHFAEHWYIFRSSDNCLVGMTTGLRVVSLPCLFSLIKPLFN